MADLADLLIQMDKHHNELMKIHDEQLEVLKAINEGIAEVAQEIQDLREHLNGDVTE